MYLLKISKRGERDLTDEDNGVLCVPEFTKVLDEKKLGQKALKYVAFVHDYDSPYRYLNERDRRRQVKVDLEGNPDWAVDTHPLVKAAEDKYNKLQRDPLDDQFRAFEKKIDQYTKLINDWHLDQETAEDLQKIMIGVEKLLGTRTVLIESIERRGERKQISGDQQLSFLENKIQREKEGDE